MLRASIMSVAWVTLVVPASAFDLVVVNESKSSVLQKLYIAPAKTTNIAAVPIRVITPTQVCSRAVRSPIAAPTSTGHQGPTAKPYA